LKNLVGGELKGYTQLLQESRNQAIDRMTEHARQMGANAIVNVRTSDFPLPQSHRALQNSMPMARLSGSDKRRLAHV
jgi:uncharacterized protein YbjQ (UPF0145 family)